jgi:hypothetical protein
MGLISSKPEIKVMKMKKTKNLAGLISLTVALAILLTACGDVFNPGFSGGNAPVPGGVSNGNSTAAGGSSQTRTTSLKACALITKEDVKPYIEGDITQEADRTDCTYSNLGIPPTVLLFSIDKGDAEDYALQKKIYSGLGGAFASTDSGPLAGAGEVVGIDSKLQDVPGLGDEAFWTGGFLIIRKGNNLMTLTFIASFGVEKSKFDILKELAQKVLSRL